MCVRIKIKNSRESETKRKEEGQDRREKRLFVVLKTVLVVSFMILLLLRK